MNGIKKYKKILKERPNDAETHFKLACEYRALKFFPQAVHHLQESVRLDPRADTQNSLGSLFLELKQYSEAHQRFSQTLKKHPDNADAFNGLGEAHFGLKRYQEAILHFSKAREIRPGVGTYHYNLGRTHHRLGDYPRAIDSFKESVRLDPANAEAHFYLGFAYCKSLQYAKAVQEFQDALKLDPKSAETYGNLGYALGALGNYQEAIKAYKEALRINPNLPEVYKNLDEAYRKYGTPPGTAVEAGTGPSPAPPVGESKGLANVAGMWEVKRVFFEEIIRPIRDPELYRRFRLSIPNGILLYGPPGCGKTFIAQKLAEELGWRFMEVRGSAIGSAYIHGTVLAISAVFKEAEKNAPTLLFIDEFEGIAPKRSDLSSAVQHKAEEVNEFLVHLNECSRKKIFLISATNEPDKIDEAVRRPGRLDKTIYIGPPDLEARIQALKMYLQDRPAENIDVLRFARALEGYPYSDISNIVDESARLALREGKLFIRNEHLEEAVRRNPSSLTATGLAKHKNFQQRGI
ncbi:MAG: tetratricopeptide repeat protein [Nitrospinae bacterium]|nr:tetratricopeptide repeat protein [Nitrospinota bacterium]